MKWSDAPPSLADAGPPELVPGDVVRVKFKGLNIDYMVREVRDERRQVCTAWGFGKVKVGSIRFLWPPRAGDKPQVTFVRHGRLSEAEQ